MFVCVLAIFFKCFSSHNIQLFEKLMHFFCSAGEPANCTYVIIFLWTWSNGKIERENQTAKDLFLWPLFRHVPKSRSLTEGKFDLVIIEGRSLFFSLSLSFLFLFFVSFTCICDLHMWFTYVSLCLCFWFIVCDLCLVVQNVYMAIDQWQNSLNIRALLLVF